MIRNDHFFEDIRKILLAFFNAQSAPATSWTFILDYPDKHFFHKWAKPFIWLENITPTGRMESQYNFHSTSVVGGSTYKNYVYLMEMELRIGAWLAEKHGGMEEINIIRSWLVNLFNPPLPKLPSTTFNVTLGATTYTGTTLYAQGIRQISFFGDNDVPTEDIKEFRREVNLYLLAVMGDSVLVT